MNRVLKLCLLLAVVCLLSACGKKAEDDALQVMVERGDHFRLEADTVSVEGGGSAAFYIAVDPGYQVVGTDYTGEYELRETGGLTKLVVRNVRYPARVRLQLSFSNRIITYEANGGTSVTGEGRTVTRKYDVSLYTRPNVSIGTDLFSREGYTLTGWNTKADGSGQRVGLGSRMTVEDTVTLYAQWEQWTAAENFVYKTENGPATITKCNVSAGTVVVPETLDGYPVETIAAGAFADSGAVRVVLPKSLVTLEPGAFERAALQTLQFFDNIESIADGCFVDCPDFSTVYISAIEDPYGRSTRRESVWVDKLDVLINTMGEKRVLFYGGCSMWYNLIGTQAAQQLGDEAIVLNLGLNGVVSSLLQMEILRQFVTENDVLVHTPEIASRQQLMLTTGLFENDTKLWCSLEYNFDLVSLLDIRVFECGFFDSLQRYLSKKKPGGTYTDLYRDSKGREYLDETLSVPYVRTEQADSVVDSVELKPENLQDLSRLEQEYALFAQKGVQIFVGYACIDLEQVPEEQQDRLALMGQLYTEAFGAMEGVTVFGSIEDFVYPHREFYDTVYHLLTEPARRCTETWLRDLIPLLRERGFLS